MIRIKHVIRIMAIMLYWARKRLTNKKQNRNVSVPYEEDDGRYR